MRNIAFDVSRFLEKRHKKAIIFSELIISEILDQTVGTTISESTD